MTIAVEPVSTAPARAEMIVTPSGIEVWRVHSEVVPVAAMSFVFEGGASQDPMERPGIAQMTAQLLDEGAGPYPSDAYQEKLAESAIELSFNAGQDSISGGLRTLTRNLNEAIALTRLALVEPRFDEEAIARVRAQTLAGIRYQMNDPGVRATKTYFTQAFPGHIYGLPNGGTLESVEAISRNDLVNAHARSIARDNLRVAVVGALDETQVIALVDGVFGDLPATAQITKPQAASIAGLGTRHVVDLDVPQSVIRFGMNGIGWHDPDFIPAYVLNHILGGGVFTSRLFQEVREKRGLAYSVGTGLVSLRAAAMTWGFTATKNERVVEALDVITAEIDKLKTDGPSEEELIKAKAYLTGSYPLAFDTSTKIAQQLAQIAFEGLGIDYITRRNALVSAVTREDVMRAATRVLGDGRMLVVIAGRPEGLATA
jgi:zinc protease